MTRTTAENCDKADQRAAGGIESAEWRSPRGSANRVDVLLPGVLLECLTIAVVAAFTTCPAWGQIYVQQGQALDANNQLGSGGLNYRRSAYDFGAANRLISGNTTGGYSFRGFSPIRDSSSLFLSNPLGTTTSGALGGITLPGVSSLEGVTTGSVSGLPSDRLSGFWRDSVGVTDLQQRRSLVSNPRPYYSYASTITNTGAIAAGLNRPGTSQVLSSYAVPRSDLGGPAMPSPAELARTTSSLLGVQSEVVRVSTGERITGPVNPRLLGSPLFGAARAVPANVLAAQAQREASLGAEVGMPVDLRVGEPGPIDTRVNLQASEGELARPARSPLDRVLGRRAGEGSEKGSGLPRAADTSAGRARAGEPGSLQQTVETFLRMRQARAGLSRPLGELAGEGTRPEVGPAVEPRAKLSLARPIVPGVGAASGAPAGLPGAVPLDQRLAAAEAAAAEPLKTFVGTEESVANRYLADAEVMLKSGQYYKAADRYDLARAVDPRNPLPLVGRAMALLAAGDYMTSSANLFQAIKLSESLAEVQIDMTAFLPDVAVLDRRRADMEGRLERLDDFNMRFLLGYVEYCSGLEELGLANMAKASASAPDGLVAVRRFVELLQLRRTAPAGTPEGSPQK